MPGEWYTGIFRALASDSKGRQCRARQWHISRHLATFLAQSTECAYNSLP